jgi:hypothetical protein
LNGIVVSGKTINCYDVRVTGNTSPQNYILMTTQTKDIDKATKCGYRWDTSILIEIYTKTSAQGNSGSRVLLNDIEEKVHQLLSPNLTITDFIVVNQIMTYEAQLETVTETENIMRSFLRLNITLI